MHVGQHSSDQPLQVREAARHTRCGPAHDQHNHRERNQYIDDFAHIDKLLKKPDPDQKCRGSVIVSVVEQVPMRAIVTRRR